MRVLIFWDSPLGSICNAFHFLLAWCVTHHQWMWICVGLFSSMHMHLPVDSSYWCSWLVAFHHRWNVWHETLLPIDVLESWHKAIAYLNYIIPYGNPPFILSHSCVCLHGQGGVERAHPLWYEGGMGVMGLTRKVWDVLQSNRRTFSLDNVKSAWSGLIKKHFCRIAMSVVLPLQFISVI